MTKCKFKRGDTLECINGRKLRVILEALEEIEKYSLIKKEDTMLSYSVRILDKIDKLKKQFK